MRKELPKLLQKYKSSNFITQERSRFIYNLCIAVIGILLVLIFIRILENPLSEIFNKNQVRIIYPLFTLMLIIGGCLFLLIKGFYNLSAHLIPISLILTVWFIMFSEETSLLIKTDTVVNIFMALAMIPLVATKYRYSIVLYVVVNILILFLFVFSIKEKYDLTSAEVYDYIVDVSVSIAFVGFLGYHVLAINKKAIQSAETDFHERIKAEREFSLSKKRYEEMAELLPITLYECDRTGRITYVNQAGQKAFGYFEEDVKQGVNVSSLVVEKVFIESRIDLLAQGDHLERQYTAIRKNGDTFPILIYSSLIKDDEQITGFRGVIIDISERIKSEEALRISEQRYKDMTMLLPQTVYETDQKGNLIFMNKAGSNMYGYSNEDLLKGLNIVDTIVKEDRERAKENINNILSGETKLGNQYMALRKDGTTFPMQNFSSPIIKNNKTIGFRGIVFDLTQIKQVEEGLKQSNELLRTLIESAPIPITLSDFDGKFLLVNKAFCDDLGINRENVIGKTIMELGVKTDKEKEDYITRVLSEKGFIENLEISAITPNGIKHALYIYAIVVSINNQKAVLRITINITQRKNLENKLRESENLFRTIVDMFPYVIFIRDKKDQITFTNKAFLERYNLNLDEVKGKTVAEIGYKFDDQSLSEYESLMAEKGSIYNLESKITSPENQLVYTLLSAQPVIIDNEPHTITTSVNITDLKLLEAQLKDYNLRLENQVRERTEELSTANEELSATNDELFNKNELIIRKNEELNQTIELLKSTQLQLIQTEKMASLGVLTAGVAHEVNNPLNYLMGVYVGLENYFQENGSKDPEKIEILMSSMQVGIERISNIVKGLNQFSRSNDNMDEDCDVHVILDNCISMMYSRLKYKATLEKNYFNGPVKVQGNVGQLHQVFVNVISNAIQAIPDKGTITIHSDIRKENAVIEIIDNGIGIEEKYLSMITDPFFTTKPPGEGTGLGLSITQTIINAHHGDLKFESKVNQGMKVTISLPINPSL